MHDPRASLVGPRQVRARLLFGETVFFVNHIRINFGLLDRTPTSNYKYNPKSKVITMNPNITILLYSDAVAGGAPARCRNEEVN